MYFLTVAYQSYHWINKTDEQFESMILFIRKFLNGYISTFITKNILVLIIGKESRI